MGLPVEKRIYTIAEYLAMEEKAEVKHEFHEGEILAMSGGTIEHGLITGNVYAAIKNRLAGKPCLPLNDLIRVRISPEGRYVYPDVSVVCGGIQRDLDDPKCTIINPRVLIEVLSESTQAYDRDEKFSFYRKISSLEEYVLVSQMRPQVESYLRQDDGSWKFCVTAGIDKSAKLASVDMQIPLAEIYEGVAMPAPGT